MDEKPSVIEYLPIDRILPNPEQPRKFFDQAGLNDLAQSIREHGVLQAIMVEGPYSVHKVESWFLIDGERRLRAAKIAGLQTIKSELRAPLDDAIKREERLILASVANMQRKDLSPIEEARMMKQLRDLGCSNNKIALRLGISAPRVVSRLKMLDLEIPIQDEIEKGRLPKDNRVVESLLEIPDSTLRVKVAKSLAERNASVIACQDACARVMEHVRAERIPENETPALRLTTRKVGEINRPVYDAIAAVGKVPPWILVEICTREVCNYCGLRDTASVATCRGCALVEFLVKMIGKVKS